MTNPNNINQYHSGKRLQKLRETQGASIIDIATSLDIEPSILRKWELEGIPDSEKESVCFYFEVSGTVFTDNVVTDFELSQLVERNLFSTNNSLLSTLLVDNRNHKHTSLDISGLGLTEIPPEIFGYNWLVELNISNNKLTRIPTSILLLDKLEKLNFSNNLLTKIPGILTAAINLKQLIFDTNPFTSSNTTSKPNLTLDTFQQLLKDKAISIIVLESLSLDDISLIEIIRDEIDVSSIVIISNNECIKKLSEQHSEIQNLLFIQNGANTKQLIQTINPWLPIIQERNLPSSILFKNKTTQQQRESINNDLSEHLYEKASLFKIIDKNTNFKLEFQDFKERITFQNQLPTIRIEKLILKNIGVYESLEIPFNSDLTVLVGLNGAGKSTILKAIVIAILGSEQSDINNNEVADLLRITGKSEGNINRQSKGYIELIANVDGQRCNNRINLTYNANTENVKIQGGNFKELYSLHGQMHNLTMGISEQRNTKSSIKNRLSLEVLTPKNRDLLPIINGEEQACISNFTTWLGNLALDESKGELKAGKMISVCFEIFSELMREPIEFGGLTKVDPLELWVKHQEPQQLVPLRLASQGYQAVMGWVGLIIQRMFEAYEKSMNPLLQPSIIIIDEIDQLLHVKWQQTILNVLAKKFFPNTQWIITTHSPMVITGLDRNRVVHLYQCEGKLIAESNPVDLWLWQYGDIIQHLFDISPKKPELEERELLEKISTITGEIKTPEQTKRLDELEQQLEKVRQSRIFIDSVYAEQKKLNKKESELSKLIDTLSSLDGKA